MSKRKQGKWIAPLSLLFLFFLFSSVAIAQPFVSQSSDPQNTFSIVIPSEQTFAKDSTLDVTASVFNTTGTLLGAGDGVSCRLQFFDASNKLVLDREMGFANDQYNITIGPEITSLAMRQEYKLFCNNSAQGGFRSGEFTVTESGLPKEYEQILLIILFVIACFLIYFANKALDLNYAFWSGMLFTIVGIYLFRHGYLGITNFISESLAFVIIGVGAYILFRTAVEYMNEASR